VTAGRACPLPRRVWLEKRRDQDVDGGPVRFRLTVERHPNQSMMLSWKWGDGTTGEATVHAGSDTVELELEHRFPEKRGVGYLDPSTKMVVFDWGLWVFIDGHAADGGHSSALQVRPPLSGEWSWHCQTCGWNEQDLSSEADAVEGLAAHARRRATIQTALRCGDEGDSPPPERVIGAPRSRGVT
jgi:hypothetical protein